MPEILSSLQDLKGAAAPAPEAAPRYVQKLDPQGRAYATGKRKDAVARVWIKPGPGKALVNGKALDSYFARAVLRMILHQPLGIAKRNGQSQRHVLEEALKFYLKNVVPSQHLVRPDVMNAFEQSVAANRNLLERLAK